MATDTAEKSATKVEITRDRAVALVLHCGWKNATKWGNDRLAQKLTQVNEMKEVIDPEKPFAEGVKETLDEVVAAVEASSEIEVTGGTEAQQKKGKKSSSKSNSEPRRSVVLEAALKALEEAGGPLNTKELVEKMVANGWKNTAENTNSTTRVYSGIHGDIKRREEKSRFIFVKRGTFGLAGRDKPEPKETAAAEKSE